MSPDFRENHADKGKALVVHDVPVEDIKLIHSHEVEGLVDLGRRKVVTRGVQHQTSESQHCMSLEEGDE